MVLALGKLNLSDTYLYVQRQKLKGAEDQDTKEGSESPS